jgi:hypothetical protein
MSRRLKQPMTMNQLVRLLRKRGFTVRDGWPKGKPHERWDFLRGKTSLCPNTERAIAVIDELYEDAGLGDA